MTAERLPREGRREAGEEDRRDARPRPPHDSAPPHDRGDGPGGRISSYGTLLFEAGWGEQNAVTVTNTGDSLVLRDSVPIELRGGDCRQADPTTVVCPPADSQGNPRHPSVVLRDADDAFAWEGPALAPGPNGESLSVFGGPGDDALGGTAAKDSLSGEEGADRLTGGDGDDLLQGGAGRDAADAGPGDDYVTQVSDADLGPGRDHAELDGGGVVRARDGAQDTIVCAAPVTRIEADLRTGVGTDGSQDVVRDCHEPGTGRGVVELESTQRRFVITRRTKTIRLRFACPPETKLMCETADMSDVYAKACECGYEARPFRILPGDTLTVPFTPPKHDLRALLHDLYWKHTLKAAIAWTSVLDEAKVTRQGVWVRLVRAR